MKLYASPKIKDQTHKAPHITLPINHIQFGKWHQSYSKQETKGLSEQARIFTFEFTYNFFITARSTCREKSKSSECMAEVNKFHDYREKQYQNQILSFSQGSLCIKEENYSLHATTLVPLKSSNFLRGCAFYAFKVK